VNCPGDANPRSATGYGNWLLVLTYADLDGTAGAPCDDEDGLELARGSVEVDL
jgi:hypothetical protein